MTTLREALEAPWSLAGEWIYLPEDRAAWTLDADCCALDSEEVAPDEEDEPNAGVPRWAIERGLGRVLPTEDFRDIVTNVRAQTANPPVELLLRAFLHYLRHDAFIDVARLGRSES